jgi:8-oxo-dGTP pyrophosphatase MutT (NUDIX family)
LQAFVTKITIAVGDTRIPLLFVVYEVSLPPRSVIKLDPNSAEEAYKWFNPAEAAKAMAYKFPKSFRELVSNL